jgi:hypothetical protein
MKRYKITYKESRDSETQSCLMFGFNSKHAEERFIDSMEEEGGAQGLQILSVSQITVSNGITKLV